MADTPKHEFVFLNKIGDDGVILYVYHDTQVSFNGSPKHGLALYRFDEDEQKGIWDISFNCKGVHKLAKDHRFKQVLHTNTYVNLDMNPMYNCMIIHVIKVGERSE